MEGRVNWIKEETHRGPVLTRLSHGSLHGAAHWAPLQRSTSTRLNPSLSLLSSHAFMSITLFFLHINFFPKRGSLNWFPSVLMGRGFMSEHVLARGPVLVQLSRVDGHMYQLFDLNPVERTWETGTLIFFWWDYEIEEPFWKILW